MVRSGLMLLALAALHPLPTIAQLAPTDLTGPLRVPTVIDAPCDNYCSPDIVVCETIDLYESGDPSTTPLLSIPPGTELTVVEGRRVVEPGIVVVQKSVVTGDVDEELGPWLEYAWMPRLERRAWVPGDTLRPIARVSDGDGSAAWLWWTGTAYASGSDFWVPRGSTRPDPLAIIEEFPSEERWLHVEGPDDASGWILHDSGRIWGLAGHYEERPRCGISPAAGP